MNLYLVILYLGIILVVGAAFASIVLCVRYDELFDKNDSNT